MGADATYTVEAFAREASALLAKHGVTARAVDAVAERLGRLAQRDDLFELGEHRGPGPITSDSYLLYRDPDPEGPVLSLAQFARTTPTHDHGTWGALCPYRGQERYEQWDREDDGSVPGRATLKKRHDLTTAPGQAIYWLDMPHDIHRHGPSAGEPVWDLIYLGRSAVGYARQEFDPEAGTVVR